MKLSFAWLHHHSVQRKLLLAIMGASCASMLVAGVALFAYLTFAQRKSFEDDTSALTEIIAANSAGSVAFKDHEAAQELMLSLKAKEQITGAIILLPDGKTFTKIGHADQLEAGELPTAGGVWREGKYLIQSRPIFLRGEIIGTFRLLSDFGPVYGQLFRTYALVFAFVFILAIGVGLALGSRARRVISDPIRSLADSVKEMSENQDFSAPASRATGGEVGQIADAFNVMVDRVKAGAELAKEVSERRRIEAALRESEERFRSLFENAPIGLYRSSQEGDFLMANPALLAMLGCATFEELIHGHTTVQAGVLPDFRDHFRDCLERIGMVEETEVKWRRCDGKIITVRESAKAIRDKAGKILYFEGCVEDITARKEAAAELQRLNRELVDASRAAGMAEVATGVLHNVGNVLNSVSVSAQLVREQIGQSKFASLRQAVALMDENAPRLGSFLTEDQRGKILPGFLSKVTLHVAGEHERWHGELRQLQANIEHMKEIVAMQQNYARVSNAVEPLAAADLLEDALRMNLAAFDRHHIQVQRDFADVPLVMVDKHKVLQILINLIRNAKYALDDGPSSEKQLKLKIYKNGSGRVKIVVADNGVGIPKENLTRIFQHGFTTRRDGHGFGLHSGAIAAKELGGDLMAQSDGPGRGATFTLELPVAGAKN
jgi:PAS domain S-box-containing protein